MDDFSIALVGPYPPPFGGVSVHVARLHQRLLALGIRSRVHCQPLPATAAHGDDVLPARRKFAWYTWLFERGWRCDADIVHFFDGWSWAPAALFTLWRGRRVVMAFHNQRVTGEMWQRTSWPARWATRRLVRHPCARWVAATGAVKEQLEQMGVPPTRITVAPAFLPPVPGVGPGGLPSGIADFVAAHSPVVSSYACRLWRDEHGVDIYGFDLCLELVGALRARFPRIGAVLRMSEIADAAYFGDLQARVATAGLGGHVLFTTEPLDDATVLWRSSEVYVRATSTDGDAVAVREALALGVPVVASDASVRPAGTVVFRSREPQSLIGAVEDVLAHRDEHVRSLQAVAVEDNFPPLLELYRAIA